MPVRLSPPAWAIDPERLRAAVTDRTRLIVVNTPMNPIGKIFTVEERQLIADIAIERDLVIVSDEVYEHLVFDDRPFHSFFALDQIRDRVVRIGSAGKSFSLTGWKVGYVTAAAHLLKPIARAHQYVTFTTPPALQSAVAVGLNLPMRISSSFEDRWPAPRPARLRPAPGRLRGRRCPGHLFCRR